jgi:hypothetical protein
MFDTVRGGATALERARATLRKAEEDTGVKPRAEVVTLTQPEPQPLTELLPGGALPTGAVVTVQNSALRRGSASLTTWLLGATQGDRWLGVVGWPALGLVALHEAGVNVERLVVVPDVAGRGAAVLAALLAGFEVVVAGPQLALSPSERRRLLTRARQLDTTLVSALPWEGAALTLEVEQTRWSGPDHGDRYIRDADLTVVRHSKADGPGRRFAVVRHGTTAPTATAVATRAVAGRLTG